MSIRSKITGNSRLELEHLRRSEALLRAMVDTTADVLVILDTAGTVEFINPAAENVMGYSPGELMGTCGWDLVHPRDVDYVRNVFQNNADGDVQLPPIAEVRLRFKDNSWHWMQAFVKPIQYRPEALSFVVNLRDISASKQLEDVLGQRVKELSALQATVLDLSTQKDLHSLLNSIVERTMSLLDTPSGFIYLFDPLSNDLELAVEQGFDVPIGTRLKMGEGMAGQVALTGKPLIIDDYTTWDGRSAVFKNTPYRAVVEVPMVFSDQLIGVIGATESGQSMRTYSTADAHILTIFAGQAANAVHNARLFQGLQQELAERKKAQELLRVSEERFRGIYENSTVGMYRTTPDGQILLVNPALAKMLGYESFDDLQGRNLEHEGFQAGYERLKFIQMIEVSGEIRGLESAWQRKDGSIIYIQEDARAIRDTGGKVLYYEGTLVDITERKQAEDEIRRLNNELELRVRERTAQLQSANKDLESFSYSVSHDLRAPLRAIDGFSHIIQDEYGSLLPAEANRLINAVRANTQQMSRLIDDLLKFSRLGRQPLNMDVVEPTKMVRQALELLKSEQEGRDVRFEMGYMPPCHGDAGLLLQVWINLLSNSLKYTRRCEHATIQIGSFTGESGIPVYFVRDNGVGFDMRFADKLFGVFQRLHNSDEFEGTGVGLALVQQIIMRHGGRIWAEASPDHGAVFQFTL